MRALGVTLVTLALVLGAGGVARRPLADTSSGTAPAPAESAKPAESADTGGSCKNLPPPRVVEIDMAKFPAPKDFVSLNTRGYNYRQPGEAPQVIPDSTGQQKPQTQQP